MIDSAVHGTHLESVVELLQWILSLSPAHVVPLGFAFDHDCTQIAALAARRFLAESERGDVQPKGDVKPEEGVGPMAVVDLQAVAVARGGGAWGGGTPGLGKVSAKTDNGIPRVQADHGLASIRFARKIRPPKQGRCP